MTTVPEEDELDPLPPLDGDAKDEPDPETQPQLDLEEPSGEASLDDTTAEDEPPDAAELDLDDGGGSWLGEPADASDLDLGDTGLTDFGGERGEPVVAGEPEEPPAIDEDYGFGTGPERGGLDGGDEGPVDADDELREEDLPPLDADDDGELDDAALVDAGFAADEPLGLPWAAEPWERVSHDGGEHFAGAEIPCEADARDEARLPVVAAERGGYTAHAARRGGVVRRSRSGECTQHVWGGRVTALAFLDDEGTLAAAVYSDADDTTAVVRLDARGKATVVAKLGATRDDVDSDGRVHAMAYDEARGVVWVAGSFGVAAFAVR